MGSEALGCNARPGARAAGIARVCLAGRYLADCLGVKLEKNIFYEPEKVTIKSAKPSASSDRLSSTLG